MKVFKFYTNQQRTDPVAKAEVVCGHWNAATHDQAFDDYNFTVCFSSKASITQNSSIIQGPEPMIIRVNPKTKEEVCIVRMLKDNEKGQHLYHRNSASRGVAFAGCRGAISSGYMGKFPLMPWQIEVGSAFIAEYLISLGLTPNEFHDHDYFAKLDGYYGDKWDLRPYFHEIQNKVRWYYEELKYSRKIKEFSAILQ
jgi:hypothetical protein